MGRLVQSLCLTGLCVLVSAACGGGLATADRSSPPSAVVTGVIHFVGGPYTAKKRPAPGLVSVFEPSGALVTRRRIHGWGHHFRVELSPGKYELNVGRQMRYHPGYNCAPVAVRARAHHVVHVVLHSGCGVP
jgi:hypothetical protein